MVKKKNEKIGQKKLLQQVTKKNHHTALL